MLQVVVGMVVVGKPGGFDEWVGGGGSLTQNGFRVIFDSLVYAMCVCVSGCLDVPPI